MDMDGLRNSTKLRTAKSWTWKERTPGTARTIVLTAAIVTLFAIPVMLTNPAVLAYVMEFAALSIEGVTPGEYFSQTLGPSDPLSLFVGAIGELGRLIADGIEWVFMEKPAY